MIKNTGLDGRSRDENGQTRAKNGNTRIDTLRETYGEGFALDWSRMNREWVDEAKLGLWATPKGSDTEQVIILGAGRNNTQAIIGFVRSRTGLQKKLDALKTQDQPEPALA